jgi:serine/threonine-protein kinase RsbT
LTPPRAFARRYPVLGGGYFLAGRAASEIKKRLTELCLSEELLRRVVIAAYEAEMNICIHAVSGEVGVSVSAERDQIRLVAEDRGPGIEDVQRALAPGFSTASEKARALGFGAGMGFSNMQRCADALTVTSEAGRGTRVEMAFAPRAEKT